MWFEQFVVRKMTSARAAPLHIRLPDLVGPLEALELSIISSLTTDCSKSIDSLLALQIRYVCLVHFFLANSIIKSFLVKRSAVLGVIYQTGVQFDAKVDCVCVK